jgi:hypothetical protein
VRRSNFVNANGQPGILAHQRSAGTRVIHVNMREQDGIKIAYREAMSPKLLAQSLQCRARARVDECAVAFGFQKSCADRLRVAHPVVVERDDRIHKNSSVAQDEQLEKPPWSLARDCGLTRPSIRFIYSAAEIRDYAGIKLVFCSSMESTCMPRNPAAPIAVLSLLFCSGTLRAQQPAATPGPSPGRQTESDEYTRYELLAPETTSFKILYEVTATTAGAKLYFNPIRKGSLASDEAVYDSMTGESLRFEVVSGAEARKDPLMTGADLSGSYIRVQLARPVPPGGQARILIVKTYKDAKSYYREGDAIIFNRGLGIRRNSVVLPKGYELVGCNVPSQVLSEPDGHLTISFMNGGPGEAPLILRAKPGAQTGPNAAPQSSTQARSWEAPFSGETEKERLAERAHQDREIVYFLQQPETNAFSLYHDYTESRSGSDKYLNVVREGSSVSDPSAYVLDTGEKLPARLMTGADLAAARIDAEETVKPVTQVVLISFPAVKKGQSMRLRISETYTAPSSYRLDGEELVFDRSLGRPRNAVVLPAGWYLTASSIPAVVTQLPDGRIRLDFWNGRPDSIDVLMKARRRTLPAN